MFSAFRRIRMSSQQALPVCSLVRRAGSKVGYSPKRLASSDKLLELFESSMRKQNKIYASMEEKMHGFKMFRDKVMDTNRSKNEEKVSDRVLGMELKDYGDWTGRKFVPIGWGHSMGIVYTNEGGRHEGDMSLFRVPSLPTRIFGRTPVKDDWTEIDAKTPFMGRIYCDSIWDLVKKI